MTAAGPALELTMSCPPGWRTIDLLRVTEEGPLRPESTQSSRHGADRIDQRRVLQAAMHETARVCTQAGILELYGIVLDSENVPAFATVAIGLLPSAADSVALPTDPELLTESFAEADVSAMRLPAGPAVRLRQLTGAKVMPEMEPYVVLVVQYFVSLPALERMAWLVFSSPQAALARDFARLFDAMAGTFRAQPEADTAAERVG